MVFPFVIMFLHIIVGKPRHLAAKAGYFARAKNLVKRRIFDAG